jgi:hypothetical protein
MSKRRLEANVVAEESTVEVATSKNSFCMSDCGMLGPEEDYEVALNSATREGILQVISRLRVEVDGGSDDDDDEEEDETLVAPNRSSNTVREHSEVVPARRNGSMLLLSSSSPCFLLSHYGIRGRQLLWSQFKRGTSVFCC